MQKIIDQLILHEGIETEPYKDTEGYLTIGIGRNLDTKGITEEEAKHLLRNDIREVQNELSEHCWFCRLDDVRQRVIIDMAFNLGMNGLFSFKNMITALKEQDYDRAADEMVNSIWYKQVKTRAKRLVKMMRTGEDYQ